MLQSSYLTSERRQRDAIARPGDIQADSFCGRASFHYNAQRRQRQVVATQAEDVMFQCVEAISRKQTDRALSLLHELHRHDPKPQAVAGRLLALLLRQYRMMWQAKQLALMGVPARDIPSLAPEIAADLPTEGTPLTQIAFQGLGFSLYSMVGGYSTGKNCFALLTGCCCAILQTRAE